MLHEKGDGIAAAAAAKTFIDLLGGRDGEGGCLFVVKGTETQIIGAPLLELDKAADDLDNIDAAEDLLYGLLGDHCGSESKP
jgi:hypothetical protein